MHLAARIGAAAAAFGLLASGVVLTSPPASANGVVVDVQINEIRIDQPSTDNDEYVELNGVANTSLDGYTYVVIGDGTGGSGVIESVTPLDGQALGADGLFLAAESTFTLGTADATFDLNFENSDNVTHLLVTGFTGSNGDDLDTNDDGTLDSTPWTSIADSVALFVDAATSELTYSTTVVGPDGSFVPGHVYRCGDTWEIGAFSPVGTDDTPGAANSCALPSPADLLLTELVVTPTGGEFVEIFNAGSGTVDLSDVYLTDATFAGGGTYYYNIVTGANAGGGGFSDFHARFPDGATIGAGEYQTVAMVGSSAFLTEHGVAPTYELFEDDAAPDAVPDMREAIAGSINDQGGLTNGGEVAVLYTWDGASDLVRDIDYAIWGDTAEAVDKTGVAIDGPDPDTDTSTYLADTAIGSQALIATVAHDNGSSWQRDDLTEGAETQTGGNGAAGSDETSEDLDVTWCVGTPTPNAATECAPIPLPNVVINEIHADPETTLLGDANGDGVRDASQDEFVELVNTDAEIVDLSGWTISDATGVRHTFANGTLLPPDCAVVVFGGGSPTGSFGGSLVQTAPQLGLNNGGDTVTLSAPGGVVATHSYGAEGGNDESLTRDPDLTGAFVGHTAATGSNGALYSPGTTVAGAAFATDCVPEIPDVFIHEVQGSGADVAIDTPVIVEAIVTSLFERDDAVNGFFVQEEDADADADPTTSEGIFVFCGSNCPVDLAVGDLVSVTGTPDDFFGMSQIGAAGAGDVAIVSSANPLPTAAVVDLPASGSYLDEAAFESLEGMLVTYPDTLAVSEYFQLGRFGQLVLTADARPFQFTHDNAPDTAGYAAFQDSLATRRVILDDDNNDQNDVIEGPAADEPYAYPVGGLSTTNRFRGGETITDLTGVLHWSFAGAGDNTWRLRPVDGLDYSFTPANPRTAAPADVGGDVTVASFNVLNYFANVDTGVAICGPSANQDCRGATSEAERVRQLDKIAAAMAAMDADVIGIIEVENDTGAATQQIVDAVNAIVGAGTYDFIDTGFIGTDAIKVGLIYRVATMTPTGAHAVLDSSVDPDFLDDKNRPALVQTFTQTSTGEVFTVAVNHLKSKGSACTDVGDPDAGDGQGNCNGTRTAAAQALADYLATDPTDSGDPDVLIIGDLNAYAMEDPITALEAAGYTDLLEAEFGSDIYSYAFDGQLGYLDHALANTSLTPSVTGATVWHINADEPVEFDYNDAIKDDSEQDFERESAALPTYEADPYRSSDHDPVLVGLTLTGAPTVELTVDVDQDDPTNKSPIVVVASFDQEVTGFDTDDVVLGGAAAPSSAAITDLGGGDYELAVSGMTGSGDVVVSIRDDAATNSGGQSSSASNQVSVDYDITPPTITVPAAVSTPADDGEAGATVAFTVTADDPDVPSGTLAEAMLDASAIECTPASGSFFPIGDTTVECTATDAAGNVAADSFVVTVVDDQDPVISEPDDRTVVVDGDGPTTVEFDLPTASDNSGDVEVVCDPASGSTFPVGTTTVTCTATDGSGNTSTTTFDIIVQSGAVTPTTTTPAPTTLAPQLPATGSSPHDAVRWAALLLAGGAVLLLVTSRRRRTIVD